MTWAASAIRAVRGAVICLAVIDFRGQLWGPFSSVMPSNVSPMMVVRAFVKSCFESFRRSLARSVFSTQTIAD